MWRKANVPLFHLVKVTASHGSDHLHFLFPAAPNRQSLCRGALGAQEDRQHFSALTPGYRPPPCTAARQQSPASLPWRRLWVWGLGAHICPLPISESGYSPPSLYRDQWKLKCQRVPSCHCVLECNSAKSPVSPGRGGEESSWQELEQELCNPEAPKTYGKKTALLLIMIDAAY